MAAIWSDKEAEERKALKSLNERLKVSEYAKVEAVRGLLKTFEGREYLRWLLGISGALGSNPFTGEAETTAYQCGMMFVGQLIMAHIVEVDPIGFADLLKESSNVSGRPEPAASDEPDSAGEPEPQSAPAGAEPSEGYN